MPILLKIDDKTTPEDLDESLRILTAVNERLSHETLTQTDILMALTGDPKYPTFSRGLMRAYDLDSLKNLPEGPVKEKAKACSKLFNIIMQAHRKLESGKPELTKLVNAAREGSETDFKSYLDGIGDDSLIDILQGSKWLQQLSENEEAWPNLRILFERMAGMPRDTTQKCLSEQLMLGKVSDQVIAFIADSFMKPEAWDQPDPARSPNNVLWRVGGGNVDTMKRILGALNEKVEEAKAKAEPAPEIRSEGVYGFIEEEKAKPAPEIHSEVYRFMATISRYLVVSQNLERGDSVLDLRNEPFFEHISSYGDDAYDVFKICLQKISADGRVEALKIDMDDIDSQQIRELVKLAGEGSIKRLEIDGELYLPQIEKRLAAFRDRTRGDVEKAPPARFNILRAHQVTGQKVDMKVAKGLLEELEFKTEEVFDPDYVTDITTRAREDVKAPKSPFARISSELRDIIKDARSQITTAEAEKASETARAESRGDQAEGDAGPSRSDEGFHR